MYDQGVTVVATIADNASNAQKAGRESPGLTLNCLPHTANLLMKDVAKLFMKQFDQCRAHHLFPPPEQVMLPKLKVSSATGLWLEVFMIGRCKMIPHILSCLEKLDGVHN